MQAVQPFIQTLLLQAMALYIHGPLRCKDLLGRIPNPHSRPALAAPQHAPGPRSDARSQRTPPGEIIHRLAAPHPAAAPATERPAPPAHLRSDRPAASRTHAAHSPDQTPSRPRWKLCSTRSPTRSGPQTARKPARLSSRTGFFFCMMEPDTARRKRLGRTTQPDRRPHCPLHPYSAGEIIHRSDGERTTSTTTTPCQQEPHRAAARAGSQPQAPPGVAATTHTIRPAHVAPVPAMGKPPADTAQHAQQPHPDRPQIS